MSKKIFVFVLLISLTEIFYQIGYKYLPDTIEPFASLLVLFAIELVIYFILAFVIDKKMKIKSDRNLFKTSIPYFLALGALGIDIGYLFLYRVNGSMSMIFNLATPFEALAVLAFGIMFFREKINAKIIAGVALSIIGVILIGI